MSLHHFGFGEPAYLLLLLVVPLLVLFILVARRRRSRYTVAFTNLDMLAGVVARRRSRWWRRAPLVLIALALAATAAAIAQPHVRVEVADRGATIVLLADVSGSMEATDVKPQRIFAAVKAMHELVDTLPPDDKVGLITFSDKVDILTPPTADKVTVHSALDVLSPEGGTALSAGVVAAVKMVVSSLAAQGVRHVPGGYLPGAVVLESDGAQDRGTISPFAAAQIAKAAGVRIYGVALGTRHGYVTQGTGLLTRSIHVLPSPGTVALLARESGGRAYDATSASQLDSIYKQLGTSSIAHRSEQRQITGWFELAAALLLVAGVAAARLRGAVLP